ncbi:MAG: hypothetical protein WD749_04075 [Phycisphaerales bacterium]
MNAPLSPGRRPRGAYQNAALTAIAVLLALGLAERAGSGLPGVAPAEARQYQPIEVGLTNALEQRKQMISELRSMNSRLERIESRLAGRIEVRVIDMPPVKLPAELRTRPEPAPAPPPAPGK